MRKIDKKRILNTVIDILLITVAFGITDIFMQKVFCSENGWLEVGIYIVLYAVIFGAKSGIVHLWKKRK